MVKRWISWWLPLLGLWLTLWACNLPAGLPGPTAPPQRPAGPLSPTIEKTIPTVTPLPATEAPTATPSSAATGGACQLVAQQTATVYTRPSMEAPVFGQLGAGETIDVAARTADGWYGFDPGVAQAGNVGVFRLRWIPPTAEVTLQGDCGALPVAPALPPNACFAVAMMDLTVYSAPSASATPVGEWKQEEYAVAVAHGPEDWVLVNLDSGQNPLSGEGWLQTVAVSLNGPCDLPAATPLSSATALPPAGGGGVERIRFAPGAIRWQKTLAAGERRFVFAAAQGQSAEILLTRDGHPANALLLLQAPDGQSLQSADAGRPDWRGVLPQSGDYRLEVSAPGGEEGLILTVTIYPLPRQPQALADAGIGYRLVYDKTVFQPDEPPYDTSLALRLTREAFFTRTNLSEAFFLLGLEPFAQADTCLEAPASVMPAHEPRDEWVVNGVTYRHGYGSEGAAGNLYEAEVFRTFVNHQCVTVYFFIHSANIGNFDPGTVSEYDAQAVMDEFKRLFFTLQWP